jgi:tetratricopeptide (TPR) repeat protein
LCPFSPCHTDFGSDFEAMAAMLTGVTWEMAEQRQQPKASKRLWAAIATVALVFVVALCFLPRPKAKEVNRLDEMKRTQQKLQEAIAADDPILMAEALLDHARQKIHLLPSPMEALRHGNLKEAWARADEFESKRRALWYLLMAWHLKAEGKDEWARKTLQRLLNSSIPSFAAEVENPLHLILLSEVAKMDWQIFDALSRRMLDTFQQALLVKHLLASNNLDGAFRIVQELKRPEDYYEERSVDEAISDVAVALAQVGRFDEALQLARRVKFYWNDPNLAIAREMVARGLFDRARKVGGYRILTEIAKAQAAKGDKKYAQATFAQAIQAALKRKDDQWLKEIVLAQAETIGIENGVATAKQIKNAALRAETLIALANRLIKANRTNEAKALLSDALKALQEIKPEGQRVNLLLELVKAFKSVGDMKQAIVLADEWERITQREMGRNYWASTMCLSPYLLTDRLDIAEQTARRIDNPFMRLNALSQVAQAFAASGQIDRSSALWDEVLKSAKQLPQQEQERIISLVVEHQTDVGQFLQAIKTVKSFAPPNQRTNLFTDIIRNQLKADMPEEAIKTIEQVGADDDAILHLACYFAEKKQFGKAEQWAERINDVSKKREALFSILQAQIDARQESAARQTVIRILNLPEPVDERQLAASALQIIATAQATKGQLADAQKTLKALDESYRLYALQEIVGRLATMGKWRDALSLTEQIDHPETKINALIAIAHAQMEEGEHKAFTATLRKALECVDQLPDSFKPIHLEGIAVLLETVGQKEQAKLIRKKAEQVRKQLKEPEPFFGFAEFEGLIVAEGFLPVDAFTIIVWQLQPVIQLEALARKGHIKEAIQNARELKHDLLKAWAFSCIVPLAPTEMRQSLLKEAEKFANRLRKPEWRSWALMQIAKAYAQLGDQENAQTLFARAFQVALKVSDHWQRKRMLTELLKTMALHGLTEMATELALKVVTEDNHHIAKLITALAEVGDKTRFKQLLPLCANTLPTTYIAVGAMAWLYPERAKALASLVMDKMH